MQSFTVNNEYFDEIANIEVGEGPIAIGGEINVSIILQAYSLGLFPWSNESEPVMWYSPDPRLALKPEKAVFSKSLLKSIRNNEFQIRFDTDFESVISRCATISRNGETGTWITKALKMTFIDLHKAGLAHSVEAYKGDSLVGGLYGLSLGKIFFGESMFYLEPNASKTAFYYLVDFLKSNNFDLIDAQQETPYLAGFGAKALPRSEFMEILKRSIQKPTLIGKWNDSAVEKRIISIV
jgi:leucyl/phenylalanyl-tRNA--protein transferase